MTERRKQVIYKLADKARMVKWLNENHEWLQSKPSYAHATRKCMTDLGLPELDPKVFSSVARAFDLLWEPAVLAGGKATGRINKLEIEFGNKLRELENRVKELVLHDDIVQLRHEVSVLRTLIHHLYTELGTNLPKGYCMPNERTVVIVPSNEKGT